MTSRGRAPFPGATSSGVGCWLMLVVWLGAHIVDDVAEELAGWPSGLGLTLVYTAACIANAVAGLRGVGDGRGWIRASPGVSLLAAAGVIAFFVLATVAPGPLAVAALLALLVGPPIGLVLLARRGWRAAQSRKPTATL